MKRILHALAALWPFAKVPLRTEPSPCESADLPIRKIASESAHPQISASAINNKTIFHLNRRYCNVLAYMALFMCLTAAKQVSAQAEPAAAAEIKPLQIGEAIPEALWHLPLQVVNHPEGKETITLNDYRGKLIILDFWATWCGSCIAAMPRILELAKDYANDIAIIPVSNEAASKVSSLLSTHQTVAPLGLYSIVNDENLKISFPHRLVPHYAWISMDGRVYAFSGTDHFTKENLALAIESLPPGFAIKRDLDRRKPLFLAEDFQADGLRFYSVLHRGRYYGVGSENIFREVGDKISGRAITNYSLYEIYQIIAKELLEELGQLYTMKRVISDIRDSTSLIIDYSQPLNYNNLYSYDISVAPEKSGDIYSLMLDDINRHTKYCGRIEMRNVECLVMKRTSNVNKIASKGGRPKASPLLIGKPIELINRPLTDIIRFLNSNDQISDLVLDETNFDKPVDLALPPFTSIEELNKILRDYELVLERAERKVPMFIIYEN